VQSLALTFLIPKLEVSEINTFIGNTVMKKIIFAFAVSICSTLAYSQTTLRFCTAVDPAGGYCSFSNTKFITSPDSATGRIFARIHNTGGLGTNHITYKIYAIDTLGKENYTRSFEQDIQPDWDMAWQPEVFASPGKYTVRVFNEAGQEMANKSFELRRDW
jgi:hypothetical protein